MSRAMTFWLHFSHSYIEGAKDGNISFEYQRNADCLWCVLANHKHNSMEEMHTREQCIPIKKGDRVVGKIEHTTEINCMLCVWTMANLFKTMVKLKRLKWTIDICNVR